VGGACSSGRPTRTGEWSHDLPRAECVNGLIVRPSCLPITGRAGAGRMLIQISPTRRGTMRPATQRLGSEIRRSWGGQGLSRDVHVPLPDERPQPLRSLAGSGKPETCRGRRSCGGILRRHLARPSEERLASRTRVPGSRSALRNPDRRAGPPGALPAQVLPPHRSGWTPRGPNPRPTAQRGLPRAHGRDRRACPRQAARKRENLHDVGRIPGRRSCPRPRRRRATGSLS
jgi:hypothetical protein